MGFIKTLCKTSLTTPFLKVGVVEMQTSSSSSIGSKRRRSTYSYSQLRTQCVQTLGIAELQSEQLRPLVGANSLSGSIQLESLVQNKDDIERDGRVGDHVTSYQRVSDTDDGFISVSFSDSERAEQEEFQVLLKRESSWKRSCLHKGLISNMIFFIIMVVGVALVQYKFPIEGFRFDTQSNLSCRNNIALCYGLRTVRSVGIFGFAAGIINWLFIELLFRKIYCLFGSGIIQKHYKDILDGFRSVILDVIFDVEKLQQFFSGKNEKVQKMLKLDAQIGGLLNSDAANTVIDQKIDNILSSPQGFVLLHMGVDKEALRTTLRCHVKSFINDISPTIYKQFVVPGISDGEGLKSEISYILEPKLAALMPMDINKIVAVMLRKHLSWVIVWGNLFGAGVALLYEVLLLILRLSIF